MEERVHTHAHTHREGERHIPTGTVETNSLRAHQRFGWGGKKGGKEGKRLGEDNRVRHEGQLEIT